MAINKTKQKVTQNERRKKKMELKSSIYLFLLSANLVGLALPVAFPQIIFLAGFVLLAIILFVSYDLHKTLFGLSESQREINKLEAEDKICLFLLSANLVCLALPVAFPQMPMWAVTFLAGFVFLAIILFVSYDLHKILFGLAESQREIDKLAREVMVLEAEDKLEEMKMKQKRIRGET